MGYPLDGWIEGPGLPQSVWRYKWLVGGLVVLGILTASLLSAAQPTRYEGVVRIYLTAEEVAAGDTERTVISDAQFIESPAVSDRVIALTGNRLTRKELEKRLTVEPSANADFITVRALDTTPTNAAALADAVDMAYRQIVGDQRQAAADQTVAVLEEEQARLTSEITQIQKQRRTADSPTLDAAEQAKRRQMEATANKIEEISADTAFPAPALQDKAAVPDEPVAPKPLLAAAMGAVVGLVIGVALAWLLAARRRVRPSEGAAKSQAIVDDDGNRPVEAIHDLRGHPLRRLPTQLLRPLMRRGAVASQESPEQVRQLTDIGDNRATEPVGQAVSSLDKDPDLLYSLAEWLESQHQNFPQVTAERLRDRLLFDRVAVLLKTDGGLDLAGCVGWHPDRVRHLRHDDRRILNKLAGNGVRQIGSADRRALVSAGLVGNEAQTIVVAPLKHENVAFGVLLVGQDESDSEAPTSRNGSFDGIGSFARSVAPDLHAWLLLHKLREQLATRGKAQGQTASAAKSVPPSVESVPPPVESVPPSMESESPPVESVPPSMESESPPVESLPPSMESESPPVESLPPTMESESPSVESESPPVWPTYPAESQPPSADSEPPSKPGSHPSRRRISRTKTK